LRQPILFTAHSKLKTPHRKRRIDCAHLERQVPHDENRSLILGHFLHRNPTNGLSAVQCVAAPLKQIIMLPSIEVSSIPFHLPFFD
jgi:hypothetical protein